MLIPPSLRHGTTTSSGCECHQPSYAEIRGVVWGFNAHIYGKISVAEVDRQKYGNKPLSVNCDIV
jgi:hypothetical protein